MGVFKCPITYGAMRSSGIRSDVLSICDNDNASTNLRIPTQPLFFIARVIPRFSFCSYLI